MKSRKRETTIYLIPLLVLLCIHPLFLRLYEYNNGLDDYAWMGQTEGCMDLFLHGKMVLFECICAACVIGLICYLFRDHTFIHLPKMFFLLAGYAVLALSSTLRSDYRQFGFSGIHEQFENIWCLLGYVLIIVYGYIMVHNRQQAQVLSYALLIGALLIGIIGLSQFVGHDLLMTALAKQLYIPGSLRNTLVNIAFGVGTVYMTLYNPGYVGLYTSLVCPLLIILMFYDSKKTIRILAAIACLLLVIGTIGSGTIGGYIGLGISFFVLFILMAKKCFASKRSSLQVIAVCCSLAIVIIVGYLLHQRLVIQTDSNVVSTAATEADTSNTYELTETANMSIASDYKLESIHETDDYVEFCYNGSYFREQMYIENNTVYLNFRDKNDQPIAYSYDDYSMVYTLTEPGLEGITSYSVNIMDSYIGFITTIDGKDWTFTYTYKDDDLSYYTVNALNRLDKDITSESAVFTNNYQLFNGRGYIWAKTIPLLKHYLIFGSGADSFALVFPQSDYLSAYKGGYENMIITKPHNIYLQTAVQTGMLSLILLLIFYIWYAVDCFRLYFMKDIADLQSALAIAIFAGTTGFLVLSLINDSTICVTPIFCTLMGMGLALNRINKQKSVN